MAAGESTSDVIVASASTGQAVTTTSGEVVTLPESDVVMAAEFDAAQALSRAQPDTSEEKALERAFIEESAEIHGAVYTPNQVEVVKLNEDATMVAPVDVDVKSIVIDVNPEELTVEVSTDVMPGSIDAGAPTLGSELVPKGAGNYSITITGWGTGLFTWSKVKNDTDGDSTQDYWGYKRKATATPASWAYQPDPTIQQLYIRNYPTTATYSNLKAWEDWSPGRPGFDSGCNSNKTVEVTVVAVTFGYTFGACLFNSFAINERVPGEARIMIDQGTFTIGDRGGPLETAYAVSFTVRQGTTPSFNDQQKLIFHQSWRDEYQTCTTTNASGTCAPVAGRGSP